MNVRIRKYCEADAAELGELFFQSVRTGARKHYNKQQREAWAPSVPDVGEWLGKHSSPETFVAEDDLGLAGFMTLGKDGRIDLAYVRPDVIGLGVAHSLYKSIECAALKIGLKKLFSEASEMAKPFFERQGWILVETQTVERMGVRLINYQMEKEIG